MSGRQVSPIVVSLIASCFAVYTSVGVAAAESNAAQNVDTLYNLVDVALTAATYLGPFFIVLGGIVWGFEQFRTQRNAQKALKFMVAGLLLTGLAFGIGVVIGVIEFVATGVES